MFSFFVGRAMSGRTAFRTCPLCEAGCGLEITLETRSDGSETVSRIRGDQDDVFSHGYVCPKGATLKHLHEDPDWLRQPMLRRDGRFVPVSWDEAFRVVADRLLPILNEHGRDAVAVYLGNPNVHSLAPTLYSRALIRALGTRNRFSASTVDQRPKEVASAMMFGSAAMPVPDIDRTDLLLMLGANPHASNGSLCTAPDFPGRLDALQARGGCLVVVDPRRSETAERADQHIPVHPGTDALLLAALAQVLIEENLSAPGHLEEHCCGLHELPEVLSPFTPEPSPLRRGFRPEPLAGSHINLPRRAPQSSMVVLGQRVKSSVPRHPGWWTSSISCPETWIPSEAPCFPPEQPDSRPRRDRRARAAVSGWVESGLA